MKKTVIILSFLFLCFTYVKAQTSFSCTHRMNCPWNEYTQEFDRGNSYEESSLFVMNEKQTMFSHTTESIKSSYYVTEVNYDKDNDVYSYSVTSDVGNKYTYIFDLEGKQIRALCVMNGKTTMVIYYVKAIF